MKWSQATNIGLVRELNEDSLCACPDLGFFAVADGMGGHNAGEVASAMAVREMEKYTYQHLKGTKNPGRVLEDGIREANRRIQQVSRRDASCRGMGTTITACILKESRLYIAHVGDSRAYLLKGDKIHRLTDDHSVAGELLRGGGISEAQARVHPRRNVLTRALGIEPRVDIDSLTCEVLPGQGILLCTDGLTAHLTDHEIAEIVLNSGNEGQAVRELINKALERGGTDNISVVFVVVD